VSRLAVLLLVLSLAACTSTPAPPAPAPPGTSGPVASAPVGKKGVGAWFDADAEVDDALAAAKVSWFYTWATDTVGISTPTGTDFVPMIWGADAVGPESLADASAHGRTLLGFNEPDVADQANLTVEQALDLWPQLMATGMRLGSPAPSAHADVAGGWLGRFLDGAKQRGHRVDFLALHWYGDGKVTGDAAVTALRDYLQRVHDRYGLPIWLTEFALVDYSAGAQNPRHPPDAEQAAFVTASTTMLDGLPFVERYAWFALVTDGTPYRTGLYDAAGRPTVLGDAYRAG
jgi:hypothetical protein